MPALSCMLPTQTPPVHLLPSGRCSPWGGKCFSGSFSHAMMFRRVSFANALKISNVSMLLLYLLFSICQYVVWNFYKFFSIPEHHRHAAIRAHSRDNLFQQLGRWNLENGISHVFGIGTLFVSIKPLDKREHLFLDDFVHFLSGIILELAPPAQLMAFIKDTVIGNPQHQAAGAFFVIHQVRNLFDHIQRIGNPTGPKHLPKSIHFIFQFTSNHSQHSLYRLFIQVKHHDAIISHFSVFSP